MGSAVEALLGEQMISRPEHGEQGRCDGGHAAGGHEPGLRVFQGGELPVEDDVIRRVVQTDIFDISLIGRFPHILVYEIKKLGQGN